MFSYFIKLSRPRFWLYALGPYWVAAVAAFGGDPIAMYSSGLFWTWFIYFLFPANFLIYGINDFADQDTDALNDKKNQYETKFSFKSFISFVFWLLAFNVPFLFAINSWLEFSMLAVFWFLSVFYSAEPIRAKSKPLVDSAFNFLYVVPGLFGFLALGGSFEQINWSLFLAAGLWCMAMHTFSAIPDIKADKDVGLKTTAVWLGLRGATIYCAVLFTASALIGSVIFSKLIGLMLIPYLIALGFCFRVNNLNFVFKVYKLFPLYNGLVGFSIFWLVVLKLYFS
jgi:4-hydroxybenzoate polyprenyltransferase